MATRSLNLLTFTAGRQTEGFHVLDSMWTTTLACAVAFKSFGSLPVVVHTPRRRRRCLRSLASTMFSQKNKLDVFCFISDQSITLIIEGTLMHDGWFVVILYHYFDLQIYRSEYFKVEGFFYNAQLVV